VAKTIDLVDAVTARREAETRELVSRTEAHLAALRLAVAGGRSPESVLPAARPDGVGAAVDLEVEGEERG